MTQNREVSTFCSAAGFCPKQYERFYLIASRSPPSHDPKLLSFFRICPSPGTHFHHFGLHFGVTFASLGPLLEHFGCICSAKKRAERQRCHQRRQSDIFLEKSHFWGHHLGVVFWRFLVFCRKSSCFFIVFSRLCFCAVFCVFLNRWEQWKRLKTLRRAAKTVCAENQKK